jgi:hypothetical protein
MKTFITVLLLSAAFSLSAQEPIEVKVVERPSSQGVQSAFEVVVPQAKANDAIESWKNTIIERSFLKKSPKMTKLKDEWIINDLVISDISTSPMNVITQVSTFPDNIYIRIFLRDEGGFIGSQGSSSETTARASEYIRNYAVDLYKKAVEKELKQEETKLKGLENELTRLQKQNRSLNGKIGEARKDEATLKGEVRQNELMLDSTENNQIVNLGVTDQEARAKLEKQLRANEKDLKKAKSDQNKFEKKARKNLNEQKDKTNQIETQKQVIRDVKTKLENIR